MNKIQLKKYQNLGKTTAFCLCGEIFTFKISIHSGLHPYTYRFSCQKCRKLGKALIVDLSFLDENHNQQLKAITYQQNKECIQGQNAEINRSETVRREVDRATKTLFLF